MLAVLLLVGAAHGVLQLDWWSMGGGPGNNIGQGVVTDVFNNIILAGVFHYDMAFNGGPFSKTFTGGTTYDELDTFGYGELYLLKLDKNDNVVWSLQSKMSTDEGSVVGPGMRVDDIATDREGNIAISGALWGEGDFDGHHFQSQAGSPDLFWAQVAANGTVNSMDLWNATEFHHLSAIALDPADNVYVSAHLAANATIDGVVVSCPTQMGAETCALTVKYTHDSTGIDWHHVALAERGSWLHPSGVYATAEHVYTTGSMKGCVSFHAMHGPQCSPEDTNGQYTEAVYIAKWTLDGEFQYVDIFETGSNSSAPQGTAIAVDIQDEVYITGTFNGTAKFGGITLTSEGGLDVFLVKTNGKLGGVQWAKSFGSEKEDEVAGVAISRDQQSAVVAGIFRGPVVIDGTTIDITQAMLLTQFSIEGNLNWHYATDEGPQYAGGMSFLIDENERYKPSLVTHGATRGDAPDAKFESSVYKFLDGTPAPVNPPVTPPPPPPKGGPSAGTVVLGIFLTLLILGVAGGGVLYFVKYRRGSRNYDTL